MPKIEGVKRNYKRSIDFDREKFDQLKAICSETKMYLPGMLELLIEAAIEYKKENNDFTTPLKIVSKSEYAKYKALEDVMEPMTMARLLMKLVEEDVPEGLDYIDKPTSEMTKEELAAASEYALRQSEEFQLKVVKMLKEKKKKSGS